VAALQRGLLDHRARAVRDRRFHPLTRNQKEKEKDMATEASMPRAPSGAGAHLKDSAARAVTDRNTILATIEVNAPPERVFKALSTNEQERWWGSDQMYRQVGWKGDLRKGGKWSTVVKRADGHTLTAHGEYIEVDSPRKIVHTRQFDWDQPTLKPAEREAFKAFLGPSGSPTTITFQLEATPNGTRVTLRDEGFRGSLVADPTASHWEQVLSWLEAHMRT
jgi:uncharacterized protein YndB with AHSA1/START domain